VYQDRRIAIVVPAFREEALVGQVIKQAPTFVDQIVVVDDASPDRTSEAAFAAGDDRVQVIKHERNKGVGGSIVTGHRAALEGGADVSVVMAGDAQMDPVYLAALLEPLVSHGYGFSKANRFFSASSFAGMPRHRVVGNIVLTFLTKLASGYWDLVDPQNGYTAITRETLERIPLDRLSERYEFENDLLIWMNIVSIRVVDVPVPARYGDEESSISLGRVIPRMSYLLFRGFWRRVWLKYVLWSFSPIALLLFTGLAMVAAGLAVGLWATIISIGGTSPTAGTVLLAVTPFLVGMQMLIQALVLDIQATPK
jgi:glycosyltransferase involved in cell wall biosynthesis